MSAHTPGPWVVGFGEIKEIGGEHFAVGLPAEQPGGDWRPVCLISTADQVNDTDRANARLIAAAPELLAACVAYMADRAEAGCTSDSAAVKAMRAAIAKATGAAT